MKIGEAKQQGEAMEEYNQDMMKVMEVDRSLMKGEIVPPTDEKKTAPEEPAEVADNKKRFQVVLQL